MTIVMTYSDSDESPILRRCQRTNKQVGLPGVSVVPGGAAHLANVVPEDGANQTAVARVPQGVTPVKGSI